MTLNETIPRLLKRPDRSFFLFGPRGTGKSTWLEYVLPDAFRLDLLDASLFLELSRDPHRLEAMIGKRAAGTWVVIDEIQKVPALLDAWNIPYVYDKTSRTIKSVGGSDTISVTF